MGLYDYPVVRKDKSIVDDLHGKKIADVYRWLEDPDSEETQQFIEKQNNLSIPFLNCSEWEKINTKLTKLWNYNKYGCPMRYGKYYYFFKNTGLQNQSVLYQQETLESEPRTFFDINALSEDGTVALSQKSFSDDGSYFAYGLSENGSDWFKIKIRDVESGKDFDEVLKNVKFSYISWTKDNEGFFYGCYLDQEGKMDGSETKANENQKLFYHRVGDSQEKDVLVAEFPDEPTWKIQTEVSDCGKYLILSIVKDCRDNIIFYANLKKTGVINGKLEIFNVIEKFESYYDYITNNGSKMYFRTNKNAPNYHVICIDIKAPAEENWFTLIPEHETDVLDWVEAVDDDKILLCYIHDVKSALQVNSLKTGNLIRNFDLDIGTITSVSSKRKYSEIFYSFASFLNPGTIYYYDFENPEENPRVLREIKLKLDGFNKENYQVEQIFFNSKDDTKIPMFIIRKNQQITPRPCLLIGYGGFNVSMQPNFSITSLMFVDTFDGVLAYPNIRGGGEYGERWHNDGRLKNKQNGFDDFQSAAEFLIKNNYTTKDRLAIEGGSNGGLLVAACINQRPDLFGAAVALVGVMDMLRFHKFTIGHVWSSDYGNPDEKDSFENLYKYSPLHNVHTPTNASEEYPATLIVTADHDDRVSPLHSLKFVATLQDAVRSSKFQKKPILLRVYTKAGHGAGKPTSKKIEESTDILTFMYKCLNMDSVNL